jgi:D-3-phosphoglycerate dehydrogenase
MVQPIHAAGVQRLQAAGIEPRLATASDMRTVAAEIGDAHAVITRSAGLDHQAIDAAPHLRVIGNHGVGLDPVDVERATELGIAVINTPGANAISVAEHAVALALAVAKRIPAADSAVRAGDAGFKYRVDLHELTGKTVGVVGFGAIGRRTAAMFVAAFSMRLLVHSPGAQPDDVAALGGQRCDDIDDLLRASDVVTLHVPLRPSTRGLLGTREIALLRPGAILVNTSRGAVIDEGALVDALRAGRLAGAGLDVFASEAMPLDHPLLSLDRVVLSPHVAGSTDEALARTAVQVADGVIDVLEDRRPRHLVVPEMWDLRRRG